MTDLEQLGDEELAALATHWRARALHGDRDANGRAHELERELRRRSGALSTLGAQLRAPAQPRRSGWAFWRRWAQHRQLHPNDRQDLEQL